MGEPVRHPVGQQDGELVAGSLDGLLAVAAGTVSPGVALELLEERRVSQVADVGSGQAEAAEAREASSTMFARSGRC